MQTANFKCLINGYRASAGHHSGRGRTHTEFKEAESRLPGNLFDTVCASLNTDGGMIFLAGEVTPEVTPEVRRMLGLMQGAMSRKEIQEKLGLVDEKHFRQHYQQPAVAMQLIEMLIPHKPRSSKQRYRLTELRKRVAGSLPGNET